MIRRSVSLTRKKPRETHLWQFDPSVFQPGPKAGFIERRILNPARSISKYSLYMTAFAYPIVLVSLGLVFGGLAFWASLAGSMVIIWLVMKKTGYEANFASWDISYRKFLGLGIAFLLWLGFIYAFVYTPIRLWTIPLMAAVLVGGLGIAIRRRS